MQNNKFKINFNSQTGRVSELCAVGDRYNMNFCNESDGLGGVLSSSDVSLFDGNRPLILTDFYEQDQRAAVTFENGILRVVVEHYFAPNGNYRQRFTITNLLDFDVLTEHGNLGFVFGFNDVYTYAEDCQTNRCHTHIWCGLQCAYMNALRMGETGVSLGVVLLQGSLKSYSVQGCKSNCRGTFVLNHSHLALCPHESKTVEFELFWHRNNFEQQLWNYPQFVTVSAPHYTVFKNEPISFSFTRPGGLSSAQVYCKGMPVDVSLEGGVAKVTYRPTELQEHEFIIIADGIKTVARFWVSESFEQLVINRAKFIVKHQQVTNPKSRLYGAYLIYDNEEEYRVFNHSMACHNACTERIGMALFVSEYLLHYPSDLETRRSFELFLQFMLREFVDEESGKVYGSIGKSQKFVRLYNAPWAITLLAQAWRITKNVKYLKIAKKIVYNYYEEERGFHFYPNGFSFCTILSAFQEAGLSREEDFVFSYFEKHAETMAKTGMAYPKHEVNYEQTIVSPAVNSLAEMARFTGSEALKQEALKHLTLLGRFNGQQPDFHLHEIPIRFWDDFWGGKSRTFGDTMPQFWSCLTARAYKNCFELTGNKSYLKIADECMRNTLCLFQADGTASCTYVYPFTCNGKPGAFFDAWANDQDFVLFFALLYRFF